MTTLPPKAIVITAYSGTHDLIKMSHKPEYSLLDTVDIDSDDSSCSGAPKKRRRLTHLSPDEKLLRRKLKNRVAAQTARDRKKALMSELEERVAKLEEENKLLKRQNVSLKETSHSLIKENAELKSRLSEEPVAAIKTETDTSSTCCSSAEGTGTDSVSMGGPVSRFCDNTQSDDILSFLHEFSQDVELKHSQAQTATPISQGISGGARRRESEHASATPVVGLSSAELESLNELIQIDHVYVKPQPSTASSKLAVKPAQRPHKIILPVSPKKNANVATIVSRNDAGLSSNLGHGKVTCFPSPKLLDTKSGVLMPGSKRQYNGQLVVAHHPSPIATPTLSASQAVITHPDIHDVVEPDNFIPDVAGNFSGSLADSDMDTSLNFLNDFGMDFLVSNEHQQLNFNLTSDSANSGDSSVPDPSFMKIEDIGCTSPPASELNPIKLFDEIYEHYLNINDPMKTDSPIPSVHSDSAIGSDVEPLSPLSNGESLNDDYLWQDLFPDLQ